MGAEKRPASPSQVPQDPAVVTSPGSVPLSFEQTAESAAPAFVSRRPAATLTLTRGEAALTLRQGSSAKTLRMKLVNANRAPEITGLEPLPGKVYHATVASRGSLAGNVAYGRVKYDDVYPGIDVVYYGHERQLEFDFLVDANRDPRQIRLDFSGADRVRLEPHGELSLTIGGDEIRLARPRLYQDVGGIRRAVEGGYRISGARSHEVAFDVGAYDRTRPLVIDPVIVFATYRGGALADSPRQIKVNALGETYLFAATQDPSTLPPSDRNLTLPLAVLPQGFSQCFLTKLSRDGRTALYTLIFEGAGCQAMDLAPDGAGPEPKVHLQVGTSFHYQRTLTEGPGGSLTLDLLQGAYDACQLGSCGPVQWMRADRDGNVYFTIEHTPTGMTPPDFVVELRKVGPKGQLLGAIELIRPPIDVQPGATSIWDQVTGLDVDESGHAYVIGIGASAGLITPTGNALQPTRPSGDVCTDPQRESCFDAFILDVDTTNPGKFEVAYASYLGGANGDRAHGVAWDPSSGGVYVTGTSRSLNFPTTPGSYFTQSPGGFLVKLDLGAPRSSQLVFGTFLRAADPVAVTVLPGGLPAVVGQAADIPCGGNSCFPLVQSLYPQRFQRDRPFLSVFSADGAALRFSTFLDNTAAANSFVSAVASNGSATVYAAMFTNDGSLATPGALQPSLTGDYDTLVQAIDVADLLEPNDPPRITFTPAAVDVALMSPSGATVPLICGRLFTCAIDEPDGDRLTHLVWLGPNGYRLSNPGMLPAPADRPGILPGDFVIVPPGSHTFTLLARDERGGVGTATVTVNVSGDNTAVGSEQRVVLTDTRFVTDAYRPLGSAQPIELTFAQVTTPGLTWLQSRSDLVPAPPSDLQAGSPPYYYDVQSTAKFTGNIRLCFDIRGMSFPRPQDELQIYAATGDTWSLLANQSVPNGDQICGETVALGTFAVFYAQVPETAIATFAGTGAAEDGIDGRGGDPRDDFAEGVPATQSTLTRPDRLARDGVGNIYVADNGLLSGARIRRIDTAGYVSTVVPPGVCHGFSPIAVDGGGQLYCVSVNSTTGQHDVLRVDVIAESSTVVASAPEVLAMVVDGTGNLFYSDGDVYRVAAGTASAQPILRYNGRPGALTRPYFDRAWGLAFDNEQHLLAGGTTLVRIAPGADGAVNGSTDETAATVGGIPGAELPGYAYPFQGDGLPASQAMLMFTYQMIVAEDGAVVFIDQSHRVRRILPGTDAGRSVVNGGPDEIVTTIAGYVSSTPAQASNFATSEYGDFRGLAEDPRSPGRFIVASGHKLQRFGSAARIGGPADDVPPTAVITAPATVMVGSHITASGEDSTDAGGGHITYYLWNLVEPNLWIDTTAPDVIFPVDPTHPLPAGTYHLQLVVLDNSWNRSAPAVATITVVDPVTLQASNDAYTVRQDATLAAGTSLVTSQLSGNIFTALGSLTPADGVLYLVDDNFTGRLRRSDGTPTGTIPLTVQFGAAGLRKSKPVAINGTLYFVGEDAAHGRELWKSDGTVAGTVLVKDIRPGSLWAEPRELTNVNGTLFFVVTGASGAELWRSDGTAAGTVLVKAFAQGWSEEFFLRNVAGTLYFRLPVTGGLWKSDGTPEGTVLVQQLYVQGFALYADAPPQFIPWYPNWPVVLGRQLVFVGNPAGDQWDLWTADDVRGARLLKSMDPPADHYRRLLDFAVVNGRLYFGVITRRFPTPEEWDACRANIPGAFCALNLPGSMPATREIWVSDGTPDGTSLVHTFGPGGLKDGPFLFTESGDSVFFVANSGADLWKTDGTSAGTVQVVESIFVNDFVELASNTLTDVDGTLFFRGHEDRPPWRRGIWKTDGTPAGTVLVKETGQSQAEDLTAVEGALYFHIPGRGELWIAGAARGVVVNDSIHTTAPTVTAQIVQPVAHGTLIFNPDGTFVYRPNAGFTGTDTFTYRVSDGTLTSMPATVTIAVTPSLPTISVTDAAVLEGNSGTTLLTFTVTRSGNLGGMSTVDFVVGGGSATPGLDYQALGGTLSFAPGDTSRQVEVPVYGDRADEGNELVFLSLTGAAGATLGRSRAFGTIANDDFDSDLAVAVTAAPTPVEVDSALTYRVVITNMGPSRATVISMTMPVDPAVVSSVSATSPAGPCQVPFISLGGGSPVACEGGSLAPGASVTLAVTVTPRSPGQIVSTFSVAAHEVDPVPANNTVRVDTSVSPRRRIVDHGGVWYGALTPDGEESPVIVRFSGVAVPGILIAEPMPNPPAPPIEYAFVSGVFDVTTTASITGLTTVCVTGAGFMPADRLVHFNGTQWEDVTVPGMSLSGQVCGQSATLSPFAVVRDVTPPRVTISAPAQAASYTLGQKISANYSCVDNGSGVRTCAGPVSSAVPFDTSSVGTKTFTVNATDAVGNTSSKSVSYEVTCRYVSLALSPTTVAAGGVVTIKAGLRSCSTARETIALRFTLSAPARPGGCSAVNTTMFTTPAMTLPPGFDQSLSFPVPTPHGLCAGPHSITVSTLVNGRVVETTSATISVTR